MEQFRGLPDQINGPRQPSTLRHESANDFNAPILIDGKPAAYLLDTGAWISVMSAAEAKRLGLTIRKGVGRMSDPSGKGVAIRTAVARELSIGSNVFHDVSFAILADAEPWRSMPSGRGGILGIPILLHLGCIRWTKDGAWELGCALPTSGADVANLVFYGNHLLIASTIWDSQVFMTLDTGAETTDLNANFARQFAARMQGVATHDSTRVVGAGGSSVIASVTVPEVAVRIDGAVATLRPAHVTMQENPGDRRWVLRRQHRA